MLKKSITPYIFACFHDKHRGKPCFPPLPRTFLAFCRGCRTWRKRGTAAPVLTGNPHLMGHIWTGWKTFNSGWIPQGIPRDFRRFFQEDGSFQRIFGPNLCNLWCVLTRIESMSLVFQRCNRVISTHRGNMALRCIQVGQPKKNIMRSRPPSKKPQKTKTGAGHHGTNIPLTPNQPLLGGGKFSAPITSLEQQQVCICSRILCTFCHGLYPHWRKKNVSLFSNHPKAKSNGYCILWYNFYHRWILWCLIVFFFFTDFCSEANVQNRDQHFWQWSSTSREFDTARDKDNAKEILPNRSERTDRIATKSFKFRSHLFIFFSRFACFFDGFGGDLI